MTEPSNPSDAAVATTSSSASIWEDFVDIFHSPSAVFARRENGSVWPPILVFTIVIGLLMYANRMILSSVYDAMFQHMASDMMKKNPDLTEEKLASMRHMQDVMSSIGVFIFLPLGIFLGGVGIWIVGKIFGATESLRAAVMIAAFSTAPRVIQAVVTAIEGLVLDTSSYTNFTQLSFSPARFLNPDTSSPYLLAVLGTLDVFGIWSLVITAIGLSVLGKISRQEGGLAAAGVWVFGALLSLIPAIFS